MSPLYGICAGIALVVSWRSFRWLADRLIFDTAAGVVFGRLITSALLGAVVCFLLFGSLVEFLKWKQTIPVSSDLSLSANKELSSFAAAVLGGIYGLLWGLIWGLVRGLKEARKIASVNLSAGQASSHPEWFFPLLLLGLAVYLVGLSYQTQPENIFGQVCQRAFSNAQRVGQACFRPEWASIGVFLGGLAFVVWRSAKPKDRSSETTKGKE